MSAWLLNNVPSWLLLLGLIVLIAGAAVLIQMYVRHRFPGLREDAHNDVTRFAFTVIAFRYASLSGFLINAMSTVRTQRQRLRAPPECSRPRA